MEKPQMEMITSEQYEALKFFADCHGRYWKQALRLVWENGDYGYHDDSASLQYLRNTRGPQWLNRFRLRSPK